jgi:dihydroorotase
MRRAGIVAVTDDGHPVPSPGLMRRAMEYARGFDLTVMDHCDDKSLAAGGVMHEGEWSLRLGLRGRPALAEESDAMRDCALAELTGARVHLAHVSTRGALEAVRRAKERGLSVTCEVAPHHFTLTDAECRTFDPAFKVHPPLRTDADVAAVKAGLADGTIDAIATDHAPHTPESKERPFEEAPPGMLGLETALAVTITELVEPGILPLSEALALLSWRPARIAGLEAHGGPVAPGGPANLTIIDPSHEWTVEADRLASRARNTPFAGRTLRGKVRHTILFGDVVVQEGKATR